MDYIKKLRKYIGHDTLIVPHSITIVIDKENKVLIEIRKDDGMYDFPGGALDIDETIEDAAIRELKEETGLIANSLELFKIYSGKITHYVYKNGDEISGVDVVYLVKDFSGTLIPQKSEVSELKFMDINEIPFDKLSIRNKQIIKDLKQK